MNILEKIEEFRVTFNDGSDWQWRKGQSEAIKEIIETYINGKYKIIILDGPCGSGKSRIALCVSWILNELKKTGYILASDISLQEQYEKDFTRFNLNWGSVKGVDRYLCIDNDEKHSLGTCHIRGKMPKTFACYNDCPYYNARDKASESPTSLLNYAYWFIMMNYVNLFLEEDKQIFKPRDFLIADEAHEILDLVQNHYSPRFNIATLEKLKKITDFFNVHKIENHITDFNNIKESIKKLYSEENQDKLLALLSIIEKHLENYKGSIITFKNAINKKYKKKVPYEWRHIASLCDWLKDVHCKVEDYVNIISATSTRNLIKNPSYEELVFNCLSENYLIHKYFHKWAGFTVLMSATFSDPAIYLKTIFLNHAKYIKIDNTFNFDKSPIYYYNKRRMSYNTIEANLPWLCNMIDTIAMKHENENGIIHSASYDLALKIYKNVSETTRKRLLIYNGTDEKRDNLEELKISTNKIILGPSLRKGLSLDNDFARFSIIAKMPYPSLTDKFVAVKLKIDSDWYKWRTIIEVIQSLGRTIRNENDWCISYILDANLGDLIHFNRNAFPPEFMQRLKIVDEYILK
jgi:Rad3-related DNA helicase